VEEVGDAGGGVHWLHAPACCSSRPAQRSSPVMSKQRRVHAAWCDAGSALCRWLQLSAVSELAPLCPMPLSQSSPWGNVQHLRATATACSSPCPSMCRWAGQQAGTRTRAQEHRHVRPCMSMWTCVHTNTHTHTPEGSPADPRAVGSASGLSSGVHSSPSTHVACAQQ